MSDQQPSVGRIVHYVLPAGRSVGQHRPAVIVRVWGEEQVAAGQLPASALGTVQLQVFADGGPDGLGNDEMPQIMWKSSVMHDESGRPNTWHWPERTGEYAVAVGGTMLTPASITITTGGAMPGTVEHPAEP